MEAKKCILDEEKFCDECGDCRMCDLDPNKVCDNCMKCVNSGAAYNAIEIDEVFESEDVPQDETGSIPE